MSTVPAATTRSDCESGANLTFPNLVKITNLWYNERKCNREEGIGTDATKKALIHNLFNGLAEVEIRTVDEYNHTIGDALGELADGFGIAQVIYTIEPPETELLDFKLPKKVLLFQDSEKACDDPVIFRHPSSATGTISFEVPRSQAALP